MSSFNLKDNLDLTELLLMFDSETVPVYMTSNRKLAEDTELVDGIIKLIHDLEIHDETVMF